MTAPHEFIVLAYGRSSHLAECLESLSRQTTPTPVTISTSTPNDHIEALASRYGAKLSTHQGHGIGPDWNAALGLASARYVTLAHQDDRYARSFAADTLAALDSHPHAAFSFCDFHEIDSRGERTVTMAHRVKDLLVAVAFAGRTEIATRLRRQLLFGFGNPVICAGVTFNRANTSAFRFREDLRTNLDWAAWLELSRHHRVVRLQGKLLERRVHASSETASCLEDGARLREDLALFQMQWPGPVARLIAHAYRYSYGKYLP